MRHIEAETLGGRGEGVSPVIYSDTQTIWPCDSLHALLEHIAAKPSLESYVLLRWRLPHPAAVGPDVHHFSGLCNRWHGRSKMKKTSFYFTAWRRGVKGLELLAAWPSVNGDSCTRTCFCHVAIWQSYTTFSISAKHKCALFYPWRTPFFSTTGVCQLQKSRMNAILQIKWRLHIN